MTNPARSLRSRKKNKKRKVKKVLTKRPYCCDLCSYSTTVQDRMVLHIMRTHMEEKPFPCDFCNYRAAKHDDLKTHLSRHIGSEPYECDGCDFIAVQPAMLENHERIHTKERPYGCDQCEFRTANQSELLTHLKTHTSAVLDTCYMCVKKPASQRAFNTKRNGCRLCHIHTCASFRLSTIHLCALCQKDCIERWSYRRTTIHLTTNSRLYYNYENGVLTCSVCMRRFKAKIGYYSHMQWHLRNLNKDVNLVDFKYNCR